MFIDLFLYAQQSRLLSIAKTKLLILCREIIVFLRTIENTEKPSVVKPDGA
jgi:hypothetical protein